MEQGLKQRLIGAAVLLGAGVILLPVLFDDAPVTPALPANTGIPQRSDSEFNSRITPLQSEDLEPQAVAQIFTEINAATQKPESESAAPESVNEPVEQGSKPLQAVERPATDQPQEVRAGITAWVVQLGSFSSHDNATALEKKLKAKDYPAFVETLYAQGGKHYRVRVGPEVLHQDARKLADKLAAEFKLETIVVRYP